MTIFRCDSVACSSFRALLFWCREVLFALFCQQQQQQREQPSISHQFSLISALRSSILVGFQNHVRHFFGAILWPVLPSVPCCFGAGRCSCYSSVSSSSNGSSRLVSLISSLRSSVLVRVPEVTLGTFSVRFWGLFVLPCLAVLVPGGAFATLLSAAATAAAV